MSRPTALITGGASGLGLAIAAHLIHHHHYRISLLDLNPVAGATAVTTLGGPSHCLYIPGDVTSYATLCLAFQQTFAWDNANRLDLFFANAGVADDGSLYRDLNLDPETGLPRELDLRVLDVNLKAAIQGINLARHFFLEKNTVKGGRIVVSSSVTGLLPAHFLPLYAASKHALVGLVRSLAPVYKKDGISINALCPAMVETESDVCKLWPKEALTPTGTLARAFDAILGDEGMTGQTLLCAKGDVVNVKPPEVGSENVEFVLGQHVLWESLVSPLLPRAPGENV